MILSRSQKRIILLLTILVVLINGIATVPTTDGDSYGTLLVADSLLRYGSLSLENYSREILDLLGPRISMTHGLPFYYFPIGSSQLSLPIVGVADLLGVDVMAQDAILQRVMASISSALIMVLMLRIGMRWRRDWAGWIVPAVFWFGTAISSSTGTSLESHDFAIVFALLAIDTILGMEDKRDVRVWGILGTALFLAYLTRPTFSIFTIYFLLWLYTLSRPLAIKTGLVVGLLLGLFVLFSLNTYGQVLPDYYLPKRLVGGQPGTAIIGNLVSPARGLFIYSSFLALVWLFPKSFLPPRGRGWLILSILWPVTHLLIISRFPHWWGGHSYGPRLMIDCLPGLLLLTLSRWPSPGIAHSCKLRSLILLASLLFSLFANTWQGMFNLYTAHWCNAPDIDDYPEYLFDWHYPQFLANERGHQRRAAEFMAKYHRAAWPRQPRADRDP
ncbi:MAG: hypothetical protein RLZ25_727 [Pseudomonadota bacterium]|jgi:hypothetical protein